MEVICNESALALALEERPVFVPTMGALHEGHLSLVRHAAELDRQLVVSIFLNPTQFAPTEDLAAYPQTSERDLALVEEAGADIVFMPTADVVYPDGIQAAIDEASRMQLPTVATRPGLEDAHRPHFFGGVCLVVGRLFDLVRPGPSIFGEKDYQQLLVISEMVRQDADRFGGVEIIGRPTVREHDGLAMSSRNVHLDESARTRALGLVKALRAVRELEEPAEAESLMREVLESHELEVDYAVVRDGATLEALSSRSHGYRALIAARVDNVRLIDNGPMGA